MLFKLFKIRKSIKEARQDPGGFVGGEVVDTVFGFLLIPVFIVGIGLVLFFLLGFTGILGGPFGFFKVLFVIGLVISLVIFVVLRPVFRLIRKGTKRVVEGGIKEVKNEFK